MLHVLTGDAAGVPFAVAELSLHDGKQYRMFGGVLASFRLARPRSGLTVVTRDRGLLGNLLARTGGAVEPITLEDPEFEGVFEVYGDDQVGARVILTTTMLQRLKALDELGHARGFACAFRGHHLLVAFDGMDWRCPAWRILFPLDAWLAGYSAWLTGLVDLPRGIVQTLNLVAPPPDRPPAVAVAPEPVAAIAIDAGAPEVFSSSLSRLVGEGGMAAVYIMSGTVFGGLAVVAAQVRFDRGVSRLRILVLVGDNEPGSRLRRLRGVDWTAPAGTAGLEVEVAAAYHEAAVAHDAAAEERHAWRMRSGAGTPRGWRRRSRGGRSRRARRSTRAWRAWRR